MYSILARRFPIWYFLVPFSVNLRAFPIFVLYRVILTISPCCLSIRLFCYVLFVAVFYSRIVQFLLHPVVGTCSFYLIQLVSRIHFRFFGIFCFVYINSTFGDIFFIFFWWPVFSDIFPQVVLLFFLVLLFFGGPHHVSALFLCFIVFLHLYFEFPNQDLIFLFVLCKETLVFSQTIFLLQKLVHLIRLYFFCIYVNTWFIFSVSILIVLHSMFLSDRKVVFCSFIMLLNCVDFFLYLYSCLGCSVSIFLSLWFISVRLFLFVKTYCVWYSNCFLFKSCFLTYL